MKESALYIVPAKQIHLAILMDGNGRWAESRGLPRSAGHRAGVEAVRRIVRVAPSFGIDALTLFAFSSSNWQRDPQEVGALFGLLEKFFFAEAANAPQHKVRISAVGRRDRLPSTLLSAIESVESATALNTGLDLRIAVDYSAREAILRTACWMVSSTEVTQREFSRRLAEVTHTPEDLPSRDVGPPDPHRRRAAPQRFSSLGMRLCGAVFHRAHVAGFRRSGS